MDAPIVFEVVAQDPNTGAQRFRYSKWNATAITGPVVSGMTESRKRLRDLKPPVQRVGLFEDGHVLFGGTDAHHFDQGALAPRSDPPLALNSHAFKSRCELPPLEAPATMCQLFLKQKSLSPALKPHHVGKQAVFLLLPVYRVAGKTD
jgi:hypothetical protein